MQCKLVSSQSADDWFVENESRGESDDDESTEFRALFSK